MSGDGENLSVSLNQKLQRHGPYEMALLWLEKSVAVHSHDVQKVVFARVMSCIHGPPGKKQLTQMGVSLRRPSQGWLSSN